MLKIKTIKNAEDVILAGILIGFITFIFTFTTLLYWQRDGFDLMEVSIMTILAGFYLFLVIIPVNIIILNRNRQKAWESSSVPVRRIYQVMLTAVTGFLVFIGIDAIFHFIDDSIAVQFAEALGRMSQQNGDALPGLNDFARLPFGIQNGIITFVIGMIATFISLPFIKKDGKLLNYADEWR